MIINVQNLIPKGLDIEIIQEPIPIVEALHEEGVAKLVQKLYAAVRAQLSDDELMWEGYWVDQQDGSVNLYIVGVLKHKGTFFSRLMRVKQVPPAQRKETEEALGDMMVEYLEELLVQLERTVGPGRGKAGWQSLN